MVELRILRLYLRSERRDNVLRYLLHLDANMCNDIFPHISYQYLYLPVPRLEYLLGVSAGVFDVIE